MPQYLVKQPNGRLAWYSTITDSFHSMNMTEDEAHRFMEDIIGLPVAPMRQLKIDSALADEPYGPEPRAKDRKNDGLNRWRGCLTQIAFYTGPEYLKLAVSLGSLTEEQVEEMSHVDDDS